MAARPTWKGFLKISLVNIPIRVFPATDSAAKVRPESTRIIDLVQFTEAAAIDPIYVERPYYLAPDGAMAKEAFAVMREGMKGKSGIGKRALYGREYLVAVQARDKG